MMNIGMRPTFNGHKQTLEVHVIGLSKDLYGQEISIYFVERLRSERYFESMEALKEQLQCDAVRAEELLNKDKSVKWGADYFKACNGKIYIVNVEKMFDNINVLH